MRVAGDRVRVADSGEMAFEARRKYRGAAPSRIHVKPQALCPAELRQVRQWIDRAGRGGSRRADCQEGCAPALPVFRHFSRQIREVHFQVAVRRYPAQRVPPEPRHVRDLVERVVGFARQVNGRWRGDAPQPVLAISREFAGQSGDHRREIRFRAATGKARGGIGGKAELGGEPGERMAALPAVETVL